ncbi:hypothetical protein [Echinicola rosea]
MAQKMNLNKQVCFKCLSKLTISSGSSRFD